jgi:hypothetical protein
VVELCDHRGLGLGRAVGLHAERGLAGDVRRNELVLLSAEAG